MNGNALDSYWASDKFSNPIPKPVSDILNRGGVVGGVLYSSSSGDCLPEAAKVACDTGPAEYCFDISANAPSSRISAISESGYSSDEKCWAVSS